MGLNGRPIAVFKATGDVTKQAGTSEFEILRADLARIFVDAATKRPGVRIVYGDHVSAITQPEDGSGPVHVEFTNGRLPAGAYDLVVGADGVWSRMRALATRKPVEANTHELNGTFISYFSTPRTANDSGTLARVAHAPGARFFGYRPSPAGTSVTFAFRRHGITREATRGVDAQKALVAEVFDGHRQGGRVPLRCGHIWPSPVARLALGPLGFW
jgi:2-polyprenyl-6-methoxyphenol hydroxylase-like FAD-dependent oxidoreductase